MTQIFIAIGLLLIALGCIWVAVMLHVGEEHNSTLNDSLRGKDYRGEYKITNAPLYYKTGGLLGKKYDN
jgi:hypothetical protein